MESRFIEAPSNVNAVDTMSHLFQTKKFIGDSAGAGCKLVLGVKDYVPLRAMDLCEARNRKNLTKVMRDIVSKHNSGDYRLPFVVPTLVAEGIYCDLLDESDNPLAFQEYRVPEKPRFTTQSLNYFKDSILGEKNLKNLGKFSNNLGLTLRNFHELGYVHMQPHMDNFSMLSNSKKLRVYATDLGTLEDVSENPFREKYMALDNLIFGKSLFTGADILCKGVFNEMESGGKLALAYFQLILDNFFAGYHRPELNSGEMSLDAFENNLSLYYHCIKNNDFKTLFEYA